MESVTVKIEGMSCDHCVRAVREALEQLPDVDVESVDIGRARVRYPTDAMGVDHILAAIRDAGYAAKTDLTGSGEALDA